MKKNELTKLFAFLEKYGINFNEYMLAKMLAWAQTKQNAEVVNEYFSMRGKESQIAAWTSLQSQEITKEDLDKRFAL